jgi:putative ABC transport system substrate-binding protein
MGGRLPSFAGGLSVALLFEIKRALVLPRLTWCSRRRASSSSSSQTRNPSTNNRFCDRQFHGIGRLGWQEGRNLRIDTRWGTGDADVIRTCAAELVSLVPDVILATNTPTARALKQATATISMVFAGLTDPIGDGIVASLSRPGANITGFTSFNAEIAGK